MSKTSNDDSGKPSESDPAINPSHYRQGGIECIEAIEAATEGLTGFEGMLTGNCIKYLWRWKQKNGVQDIKKCRWYLDKLIEVLERQSL
jgi:hypothetical protein